MAFQSDNITIFKQRALQWATSFEVCCCLESNGFKDAYHQFDTLIAIGVKAEVNAVAGNAFAQLQHFRAQHKGWMTGFVGYDLKNELEALTSDNPDQLQFPDLYFFVPEHLIIIRGGEIEIQSAIQHEVLEAIQQQSVSDTANTAAVHIKSRLLWQEYIDKINQIKEHISRGDIYVTNFCQEFYAEQAHIQPLQVWQQLNGVSPNPFACFFKYHQHYILGASPERYLAKRGQRLISQPIKGTAPRSVTNDEYVKNQLRQHPKEQQENVMIVDLVRNDLTRCAVPGSVQVKELFGIYSFAQVHQMISTVIAEINPAADVVEAIKSTFPMGSMTGAPKVSAMQLMEHYEVSKRGIYSGTVGYFDHKGDFDFNVVIRTVLYNAANRYLSFQTGSAITFDANAEQEYQECLLKAKAILQVLGASNSPLS
ncbi:anthranilate synthase component I family protein [Mucilaginibacter koreensis]